MKKVKLLWVIGSAKHLLSHYLQLAKAAQQQGYEIHIASPQGDGSEKLSAYGFIHHPIALSRKSTNPLLEFLTLISLFKLYRELKPDVVHHFTIKPIIYGGIVARLTKIPAVISVVTGRGYVFVATGFKPAVLRWIVKPLYRIALHHKNSRIIFQNQLDKQYFVQHNLTHEAKSILILGAGVDLDTLLPMQEPAGKITVILPARMLKDKGITEFVAAAKIIKRDNHTIRMILVGAPDPGNPNSISLAQLQAWATEGTVEYWGWQEDMLAIFQQAHIVCLPSYGEGMPRVLIEAAAYAKPIVTTDVAGCNEIIQHNKNGLLAKVKDPVSLAHQLMILVEQKELREKFGLAARKTVEESYGLSVIIQKNLDLYRSLFDATLA